jgi:hypothetical protein
MAAACSQSHAAWCMFSTAAIYWNAGVPDRKQLDTFIKGWEEGLQLMSEGSIYRFYIPPIIVA